MSLQIIWKLDWSIEQFETNPLLFLNTHSCKIVHVGSIFGKNVAIILL